MNISIDIPTPRTDAEAKKPAFSPSEWIKFTRRLEQANGMAVWALEQMLNSLPTNRDWLDPDIETIARAAIQRARSV